MEPQTSSEGERPDVFICHASEDKATFVRDLAGALRRAGVAVWYDEFSLHWGSSLRRNIDAGLAACKLGIVVLSEAFFQKGWAQRELDGLTTRELGGDDVLILPIWHGVRQNEVAAFSPPLADKLAVDSSLGIAEIVSRLIEQLRRLDPERVAGLPTLSSQEALWRIEMDSAVGAGSVWRQADSPVDRALFSKLEPTARCRFDLQHAMGTSKGGFRKAVLKLTNDGPDQASDVRYGDSYEPPRHVERLELGESLIVTEGFGQDDHFEVYATWTDGTGRHRTSLLS